MAAPSTVYYHCIDMCNSNANMFVGSCAGMVFLGLCFVADACKVEFMQSCFLFALFEYRDAQFQNKDNTSYAPMFLCLVRGKVPRANKINIFDRTIQYRSFRIQLQFFCLLCR